MLQKFGTFMKKKDPAMPFYKTADIEAIPLDSLCQRPKEFFQEPKPFSFRDLGKILVPPLDLIRLPEYDPFCPVHGSRRRFGRRHLVTMQHLMTSVDQDDAEETAEYLYNQDFLAKIIRKKKREMLSGNEKIKVNKVMHKIKILRMTENCEKSKKG
ncbi:hypothetical protein NECAME_11723 [Necator americanus]|uniref:Uncharacterized protein n=1 Tax=Necator americanus TaxID=51031 RepID=W2T484_NECAM|nr:hypothetical protein NECAME_11723 [Necator americanus]ETN76369.1 hypothetical protein NECAME_11723 [Necator americanus]